MKVGTLAVSIALVLIGTYELAFRSVYPAIFSHAENQWINNYIIAQQYIYERADVPLVIVGSSLSTRLDGNLLPPRVFNLSLSGLSAFDGLRILVSANTRPRTVFIETNVLYRDFNATFGDVLLTPGLFTLRRWLLSLRADARPVAIGRTYLQRGFDRAEKFVVSHANRAVVASPPSNPSVIFAQLLASQIKSYEQPLTDQERDRLVVKLRSDLAALKRRGTAVIFYELPIHPKLCEAARNIGIRRIIRDEFPDEPYVRIGDCRLVTTADGVHLAGEEAARATRQFADILE